MRLTNRRRGSFAADAPARRTPRPARGAVIHADHSIERLQRGHGLPLILLRDHTDHKLRTETPTCLLLQQRGVAVHHAALTAIVVFFDDLLEDFRFGYLLLTHTGQAAMRFGKVSVEYHSVSLRPARGHANTA